MRASLGLLLASTFTVLAGCTPIATAMTETTPEWGVDFIADYEDRHGDVDDILARDLLAGANASCGDLVAKSNLSQVWQMNVDRGMSSDQSATVIELAVKYYCPEFDHLFTAPFVPRGK